MKALLITILLFTAAILVYDRFITPAGKRFVFENPPLDLPERESGHVHTTPAPRAPSHLHSSSPAPADGGFVPPQIEPLESLTKNWTVFPPRADALTIKQRSERARRRGNWG